MIILYTKLRIVLNNKFIKSNDMIILNKNNYVNKEKQSG